MRANVKRNIKILLKGVDYMIFTSESVSAGHPDKMADLISDRILDEYLTQDPIARVACETLLSAKGITLAGEITSTVSVNHEDIARKVIRNIDPEYEVQASFTDHTVGQSPDIAEGVDTGGAGDQGLMFGYSTNETPERLPLPIALANRLIRRLDAIKNDTLTYLKADAKSQVTVAYNDNGKPSHVDAVVISTRHDMDTSLETLRFDALNYVIKPVLGNLYDDSTTVHINPAGSFVLGGPLADTGLTGRKIIVDTYGGFARHGGGAFSGKDATKVDRSGAYMARYIANHVIASEWASKCEIQLAYAIGVAEPVSVRVDTFGTETVDTAIIERAIIDTFDMTPRGIIEELQLTRPIYAQTAVGGHFGRSEFAWEQTPRLDELLAKGRR